MPAFVKTHKDQATAARAVERTEALCAAGVPVPAARAVGGSRDVAFDLIEGDSDRAKVLNTLPQVLGVLSRLHAASVPDLRPFDPLVRVRARRGLASSGTVLSVLEEPVPTGNASVHGDFHVGQVVLDRSGSVWIVDLDDMAHGPPEADLANFVAHLATSGEPGVLAARHWTTRVLAAARRSGHDPDQAVFDQFLRFALVRRHLKLREAGRPDFEAPIAGFLSGATVRTSPSDIAAYHG